jgi:sugar phosphate isomerase/epimerase
MSTSTSRGRIARGFIAAALATCMSIGAAGSATAAAPECAGKGVPASKVSIQLWTFAEYIGFGTDAATIARTEEVLRRLSEMGYRNVEPFTLSGLSAEQYRALLDKYGLKASARHVGVGTPENPVDIDAIIEENRILGIKYFGAGSTPIFPPIYTTEAEWIAYAEYLDELGEQARQAGQTLMVHNHDVEFEEVFGDRTAFDILVEHTDPRNVVFQVDLYWAANGLGSQEAVVDLLEDLGKRVQLFHVKDMAAGTFPGRIEIVGEGILDFPQMFATTQGPVRYYVVEHDPRFGDPTFDPFEAAEAGFEYMDCVTY